MTTDRKLRQVAKQHYNMPLFLRRKRTEYHNCTLRNESKCEDTCSHCSCRLTCISTGYLGPWFFYWIYKVAAQEKDLQLCLVKKTWVPSRRTGSTYRGYRGTAGTTLSAIGCTQDEVGNWNIIRNLITLELKKTLQRLSSSTKMMTVSPKCSTLVSGYQVWTWGICHILDNAWCSGTTS